MVDTTNTQTRPLRYIIIGAGMAGILAGIRLKERGEHNFVIYEKGDTVGGTWRENTYPGLSCDVPAHSYTYSFAPNPDWSAYYAPGPEIQEYFERMTDEYGVREFICFNSEVVRCQYLDGQWEIETHNGRIDRGDAVIAATGVLHHPKTPDIPGLDSFAGRCFHSARWDHSVNMEGKRVGVIGNGSTGIQIVTALSEQAARVVHFQRTPQWIMPVPDIHYSEDDKHAFRKDPSLIDHVRNGPEAQARRKRFLTAILNPESEAMAEIERIVKQNLEDNVQDPELREKLRPTYRAACKRLVFSAHYYEAVQQPSVYVDITGIEGSEPNGVRMQDGSFHELDVLVLATGFHVDRFIRPTIVTGRDGITLDELWKVHPTAYYAVTLPHFPNFFMLNGPTGPVGNFSLIDIAENQWGYIDQLLDLLREGECREIAPTESALDQYEIDRAEAAKGTVFATGCSSWYLDKNGVPQVWPWTYEHFLKVMSRPALDDYELR